MRTPAVVGSVWDRRSARVARRRRAASAAADRAAQAPGGRLEDAVQATAEAEGRSQQHASESAWRRELVLRRYTAAQSTCGVTQPNGSQPPDGNIGGALIHGNGSLWVAMPPSNVVVTEPSAGGTIQTKYPWWRAVTGTLRIEGRRLDGPAAGLTATDVPDGYGVTGFQASAVTFPTEGCWEVTGRVGEASLTFVTLVLKAG